MNSRKMSMRSFVILAMLSLVFLAGCGGSKAPAVNNPPPSDSPGTVAVSVSPATTSVEAGASQLFTATVQNDPANKGVTWGFGGCPGACGTIDPTGKYTAPVMVTPQSRVFVTATSVADPTKTATATVTLTPAPDGVAVSPSFATVQNNGVVQFSATVSPWGANQVVSWSVSGAGCSGASCGAIDSSGRYTAPLSPPTPPTIAVTATALGHPGASGSATVVLRASNDANNTKLNGRYAFLLSGYDGDGFLAAAGSVIADGQGNITNGVMDVNHIIVSFTETAVSGTYAVGPDNRGSMILNASSGRYALTFALSSFAQGIAERGRLVEFDSFNLPDVTGTGFLARQNAAAFSALAIRGGYAFSFAGQGTRGSFLMAADGRFTASGGGSLTDGQIDVNDGGSGLANSAFNGSYSVDANGRGAASLATLSFILYVVSADELLLLQAGPWGNSHSPGVAGLALRQSGGPFTAGSLNGPTVSNLTAGGDALVAEATFDGSGSISGALDENSGGSITSNAAFAGNYTVNGDGLGRGAITINGDPRFYSLYLVSPGKAFIVDSAGRNGMLEPQTGSPFNNASLAGNYSVGTLPLPMIWAETFIAGAMTADGAGNLTGTADGSRTGQSFTGTYSVAANGRATLAVTPSVGPPSNMVFYLISPSKAVAIQVDAGGANSVVKVIEK